MQRLPLPDLSKPGSRRPSGPRPVAECSSFAALARKAGELDALDRALRQTLPTPLREQVRFAHLRNGRLVFLATSPAWASRLRLMQAQILATASAIGASASSVSVKVAPPLPIETIPDRTKPLSSAAATHLHAAAAATTDLELRGLFQALAAVAASRSGPLEGSQ